jgi:hypothetical protein
MLRYENELTYSTTAVRIVSGHGFGRAARSPFINKALAPQAGYQRLKPPIFASAVPERNAVP